MPLLRPLRLLLGSAQLPTPFWIQGISTLQSWGRGGPTHKTYDLHLRFMEE